MMEAVNGWLDRAITSSLDVPHPAELDSQKTLADAKTTANNATNASNIVPFRIFIKSLEILPSSVPSTIGPPYEVQLSATLYDNLYRRFFGQTWFSSWHKGKVATDNFFRVDLKEPLYCYIPMKNDQNCLVIQTMFRGGDDRSDRDELVCGWTVIKLRSWGPDDDIKKPISDRQPLYHGSPRALMFLNEPVETSGRVLQVASAKIFYEIRYHEPLFSVIQYLSECTLYGKGAKIGGIYQSSDREDILRNPSLQENRKNILLEQVEIHMEPSIEIFEEELCRLVNQDRIEKKRMANPIVIALAQEAQNKVSIVERRLRVGIHNGQCYVQDPLVLYLTAEQEDTGLSSLSRKLSFRQTQRRRTTSADSRVTGTDDRQKLYLRNPIRLDDVPLDDLNAVIFVLEYMLAIPVGTPSKPSEPIENTTITYTIRWTAWFPGKDRQVVLIMSGGETLPSDELFVYKPSKTTLNNAPDRIQEILKFNYRFDTDAPSLYKPPLKTMPMTPNIIKRVSSIDRSATLPADYELVHRTPVPARTIPSAVQPPIYHSSNLVPWQTDGIYPAYSPMSVLANQMIFAHSLTRAAVSRLQGHGFATIKTINDKDAEYIDIRQSRLLDMKTELADPMNCNQIHFHFLSYFKMVRSGLSSKSTYPKSLYFTFKFYRFPETTTNRVMLERTHDTISNDPNLEQYILWRFKEDSTKTSGLPGLPVKFQVDGGFLGSVEQRQFFDYLNTHVVYIEVWDGDGLFPVGVCALELRYLLRDGRPGVQALIELDVFSTLPIESSEEPIMENQYYQSSDQQFSLIGEKLKIVGKLILRIGNVGSVGTEQPSVEKLKATDVLRLLPTSRIISSTPPFDIVQQRPGEITTGGIKDHRLTRAHRIVDAYPNINTVLHSGDKQALDADRQRKLARMEAVRRRASNADSEDVSPSLGVTNRKTRELRDNDLRTISMYRQQTKHKDIAHHLMNFITRELHIRLMPGYVEFFEFVLQNPYPEQHTITIACDDDELSVVTDTREWRRLKTLFEVFSDTEEKMFTNQTGIIDQSGLKYPQIFMRAKESIHIPFKLQTFLAKLPSSEHKTASSPYVQEQSFSAAQTSYNEKFKSKQIKALFQAEDGTPIGILSIYVEYMSPIIDQTIRCFNGENTILKRVFRVPNPRRAITNESLSTNLPERIHQVFVRASDLNIVCEAKPVSIDQPCDMLIKAPIQNAPTVNSFLVFMYPDGFLHKPINVWQFQIHAVKRLDLTSIQYQTTTATLLLRGARSSRLVQCFGNIPEELVISPSNAFSVAANGLNEIHLLVRPSRTGLRSYSVNAVDVENHQIVDTWMIRVDTRMPVISKQFAQSIPYGQSQSVTKSVSYTNPYAVRKTFFFASSHPELLQLQNQKVDFQANEKRFINFTLLPAFNVGPVTDILILINNEQDTNEDAYCVRVTYTDSHSSI